MHTPEPLLGSENRTLNPELKHQAAREKQILRYQGYLMSLTSEIAKPAEALKSFFGLICNCLNYYNNCEGHNFISKV